MNAEQIDIFDKLQKQLAQKEREIAALQDRHEKEIEPLEAEFDALMDQLSPLFAAKLGLAIGDNYRCRYDYNGIKAGWMFTLKHVGKEGFIRLENGRGAIGIYGPDALEEHWVKVE